jgi:hypothetical protein
VSRFLAIDIEGKIGQLTVRRTSSFIISILDSNKAIGSDKISNTMIISVKNEIAKPLCLVFNKSLRLKNINGPGKLLMGFLY